MNNIMDKVSLEMAIKLKEMGFNAYCRNIYIKVPSFIKEMQDKYPNWYFEEIKDELGEDYEKYVTYNYEVMEHVYYRNEDLEDDVYACPNIIDVYEWLREHKNIYITIMPSLVPNDKGIRYHKFHIHAFNMELLKSKTYSDSISYEDYNEARFKAIEYVLFHNEIFDMVEEKNNDKDGFKIGDKIVKKSGKPFKCGLKKGTIKGFTINPHSNKSAVIILEDDSIVNTDIVELYDNKC